MNSDDRSVLSGGAFMFLGIIGLVFGVYTVVWTRDVGASEQSVAGPGRRLSTSP